MGEKIVVGPINKGLRTDRTPFVIDNDSFPTLINAYQWRGRVKRKRGTVAVNRLQRFFNSQKTSYSETGSITLDASGNGNLLTGFTNNSYPQLTLEGNGEIIPGTVIIVDTGSAATFTDPAMDGTLSPSGSINYSTGQITIAAEAGDTVKAVFSYYPCLPVMGLEDLNLTATQFPGNIAFDTTYAYNVLGSAPYTIYDVSFYKNPATATYTSYTAKTNPTPVRWHGKNYQQFWATNYEGALWATNGIAVPFVGTNIGMQFIPAASIGFVSQTATTIVVTIASNPLVIGDFVFLNEWTANTAANAQTVNFQTGYVSTIVGADITLKFPNAAIAMDTYTPGIIQCLTTTVSTNKDCMRWYDGDPTNGNTTSPALTGTSGWVNFCPPVNLAPYDFNPDNLPPAQYYLVSARIVLQFKDRLLFFGPIIQTSSTGPFYLQDAVIYSQNGSPYYTASFSGANNAITSAATQYTPILTPTNQSAQPNAYFYDVQGYGGYISAGYEAPILTVAPNQDVLIVGFATRKAKLVYSGNDIVPFNFFIINSELGDASTFSTIILDRGVFAVGNRGITITNQVQCERFDEEIPDQVFEIDLFNNGAQRTTATRDFINEWVYFTYTSNSNTNDNTEVSIFPNQTLLYNYRDSSWAIFNECYTTYGQYRRQTGQTWATIGTEFETWAVWDQPWNAGETTLLQQQVIAGNQQGFVVIKGVGTEEVSSVYISNISFPVTITGATAANPAVLTVANSYNVGEVILITGVVGMTELNGNTYTITAATPTTITINVDSSGFTAYISGGIATTPGTIYSPNHCLQNNDYIIINGCLGTIGTSVNGNVFSVFNVSQNYFSIYSPTITPTSGTYLGSGTVTRMYVPLIQTKQFPVAWEFSRKTRLGPQAYLFTFTENGQVELQIYLSQDAANAYNAGTIVPDPNSPNNALLYSDILFTSPIPNNLQTPTASTQSQIWQRMNTSLIGDTVQIGITLNDAQMRDPNKILQFAEIELHSLVLDCSPSQMLV